MTQRMTLSGVFTTFNFPLGERLQVSGSNSLIHNIASLNLIIYN